MERVFVYGTLMRGFGNHRHYKESLGRFVGYGSVKGVLYHFPREGYPGLLEESGDSPVRGEVYELEGADSLRVLDRLEGYDEKGSCNLYEREKRPVSLDGSGTLECWVYFFSDREYAMSCGEPVASGDWRAFIQGRNR
ncbi:MAG: gamma-glutamylcyclotransferase family protein [Candidatus Eremiobacteraeota bacterium]|nr:gamma-glutamylcyclotransferase family protein [Candidatus Eremiobacteraeota bacterium]